MRWLKVRFSLRTLLVALAVVPAIAYWFGLPTLNAYRYSTALDRGDFAAAARLCTDQREPTPGKERDWLSFGASVRIETGTLSDWIWGRRRMTYFWRAHMGSMVMSFVGRECVATRRGIEFPPEDR